MSRRSKHITPSALRGDHSTPLNMGELTTYMDMAYDDLAELETSRASERSNDFFFSAGTRAIPITPMHATRKNDDILDQRDAASDGLLRIVKSAMRYTRRATLYMPKDTIVDQNGLSRKSDEKIVAKAKKDYKGEFRRVVDMVRCTILTDNVDDLQILSEVFRPCAMPDVVRFRNDFAHVNRFRGNLRRLHINPRIPDSGGHVGEIFVYCGTPEQYEKSRKAYGQEKAASEAETRAVMQGTHHRAIRTASQRKSKAHQERVAANDALGQLPEIRDLVINQRFFTVDEYPVVVADSAYDGQSFSLVPNPATGFWETDQRFLEIILNPGKHKVERVIPFEVAIRGQAVTSHTELRQRMSLE